MKVLVTGGAGFLGHHICTALESTGHTVVSFDIAIPRPDAHWETIQGSILDYAALTSAGSGCDAIIHTAAIAELWTLKSGMHHKMNVLGTQNVIDVSKIVHARLVYVSSYTSLIAGQRWPERTLDENEEIVSDALLGLYPRSKREAELRVISAAHEGVNASIVLPPLLVGPGDHNLTPPSRMIRDLAPGKLPAYLDCFINMVDVRAVAAGVVQTLERGRSGERYLLSGDDVRLGELTRKIARLTGIPAPKIKVPYALALTVANIEAGLSRMTGKSPNAPLTGVRLAGRAVKFANAKARRELGFEPGSLDDALRASLAWMAGQELIPGLPASP